MNKSVNNMINSVMDLKVAHQEEAVHMVVLEVEVDFLVDLTPMTFSVNSLVADLVVELVAEVVQILSIIDLLLEKICKFL
jgi:hypothetical protein